MVRGGGGHGHRGRGFGFRGGVHRGGGAGFGSSRGGPRPPFIPHVPFDMVLAEPAFPPVMKKSNTRSKVTPRRILRYYKKISHIKDFHFSMLIEILD